MPRYFVFDSYHSHFDWDSEGTESPPYLRVLLPLVLACDRVVTTADVDEPRPAGVVPASAMEPEASLLDVERAPLTLHRDEATLAFCNTGNRRRGIAIVHSHVSSGDYSFFRYCAEWHSMSRGQIVKGKPGSPLWRLADSVARSDDAAVFVTFGLEHMSVVAGASAAARLDSVAGRSVRPFRKWHEVSDPSAFNIIGKYHLEEPGSASAESSGSSISRAEETSNESDLNRLGSLRILERGRPPYPNWNEWTALAAALHSGTPRLRRRRDDEDAIVDPLTFVGIDDDVEFPEWMPGYVAALRGMSGSGSADVDGYALAFTGKPSSEKAMMFGDGVLDPDIPRWSGYPDAGLFPFQRTESGRLVHIDKHLRVLWPNNSSAELVTIATLEEFTKAAIRESLAGRSWVAAFPELESRTVDDE